MSCLSKHWGCVLDMALQMSPLHLSLKASSFWRKIQTMWRVRTNVIHDDITCTQLWLCSYYGLLLLCCTPVRNMQCMFGLEHCTLARGQATPIVWCYFYTLAQSTVTCIIPSLPASIQVNAPLTPVAHLFTLYMPP